MRVASVSLVARAQDGVPYTVEVTRGDFDIRVVGSARLDARRSVTIASDLPSNEAKVVWLVPEGQYVEVGDSVARFDPVPFEEQLQQAKRDLDDANAALAQAEAELQIQVQNGQEKKASLEHKVAVGRLRLQNFDKADGPLRESAARNELDAANVELERTRQELAVQEQMVQEGFGNENLLREAKARAREAESRVALAKQQLKLLRTVLLPSEREQASLELETGKRELENSTQANLHNLAKHNAALVRLRTSVEGLANAERQARERLGKTELKAPVAGFVVYKSISVVGERRKVQVGDSVWNRHGFMVIPDMSSLVAYLDVREQQIGKLALEQPVALTPDAYPELELAGRVDNIGTLAARAGADGENRFTVRVALEQIDPRLRPGMRARASILAATHADVLRVPVEAVFYDEEGWLSFVLDGRDPEPTRVELGASDGEYVIVLAGLSEGDRVLLSDPR